jgi:hypothetical protein
MQQVSADLDFGFWSGNLRCIKVCLDGSPLASICTVAAAWAALQSMLATSEDIVFLF